jgi:hypothetical protein
MADSGQPEQSAWIVEPPGQGEVHLSISVGEGVEVTPETEAAVENLLSTLLASEVEAFGYVPDPGCGSTLQKCSSFTCGKFNKCRPVVRAPCAVDVSCKIGS